MQPKPLIELKPSPRRDELEKALKIAIYGMGPDWELNAKQKAAQKKLLAAFVDALVAFSNGYRTTAAGRAAIDDAFRRAAQVFASSKERKTRVPGA
jgi:hypothetical protein